MDWNEIYKSKLVSCDEAVKCINSGDRVYVGTGSSTAYGLLDSLWKRRNELKGVTLCGANGYQYTPCYYEKEDNPFEFCTCFMGINERAAQKIGKVVDYTSMHLSMADVWSMYIARPDVCFFEVSKPDKEGYCSFGPSNVSVGYKLKEVCKTIIIQINENTPYCLGEYNKIHISEADYITEKTTSYDEYITTPPDEISNTIASYILELIPDGATFQLGIGNISTAIGYGLKKKNDLGIYTELFNQPMLELMKSGNVTNKYKGYLDGKTVYSFTFGSPDLYKAMDNNPEFYGIPFFLANDPRNVSKNNNMISINSVMAFNIFGEACADCIGWKQQSGTGGQIDFVKGAQWAPNGKSILCTQSYFIKDGKKVSKIMPFFAPGSCVTTPRSEVQYVATEYGCVNLQELSMNDRVKTMISLAHPDFRDELKDEAKKHGFLL